MFVFVVGVVYLLAVFVFKTMIIFEQQHTLNQTITEASSVAKETLAKFRWHSVIKG